MSNFSYNIPGHDTAVHQCRWYPYIQFAGRSRVILLKGPQKQNPKMCDICIQPTKTSGIEDLQIERMSVLLQTISSEKARLVTSDLLAQRGLAWGLCNTTPNDST